MAAITLSNNHQKVYDELDLHMKDLIDSHAPCNPETTRLLLELIKYIGIKEDFYTAVMNYQSEDINQSLKQLLAIVKQGWREIFFECAFTHNNQYYCISTLVEMIDLFHQIAPHFPQEHPPFKRFPPFDYGGKELLLKLVENPTDLTRLLRKEEPKYLTIGNHETLHQLSLLNERQRLSIGVYEMTFQALQKMKLNPEEKQIVKGLLVEMTTNTKDNFVHQYSIEYLENFLRIILDVHEYCGEEPLIYFCRAPDLRSAAKLDEVIYGLEYIKAWCQSSNRLDELFDLLLSFYHNKIGFAQLLKALETSQALSSRININKDSNDLRVLYQRFSGEIRDPNVVFPLPIDILQKVRQQYEVVQCYCEKWEAKHFGEWVNLAMEISEKSEKNPDDTLKLVAIGRLAIRHEFHIYLHNTQIWAVLAQLNYPKGSVAQMITGEGKSKVTTLLAFVLVMMNPSQGHMISSSRSLSVRDQKEHFNFFKTFGIKTTHICKDNVDVSSFQARILYGTATDFEFALMRQMLYFEKLFPLQAFEWVIVDEIDNLTIDTALSGARLSYRAEVTYDWVYVPIFSFVQECFPIEHVSKDMLGKLRLHLEEYMEGKFSHYVNYFSDKKLKNWIQAACKALKLKEKENYILAPQDSIHIEKAMGILIVDAENTGRIQYGSRWSGGVHEFVEVKHGLEVARESVCPISMTHPVFYPMYKSLFGVTGTIGSRFEREELKTVYHIDSFDVPTHYLAQRKDAPVIALPTDAECIECHVQAIQRCIQAGRPILILCRNIKDTEVLGRRLEHEQVPFEMLNEIQKKSEQEIINGAGFPGSVTIATNTAGRGTNIRLSEESLRNGGLHVLITFYPESDRVELQARGRAGRQGQPGSSEIIISGEHLDMDPSQVLSHLSYLREQEVIGKKDIHIAYAKIERSAFQMVREFYRMLKAFHELASKDAFLERLSTFLANRKFLRKEERDFSRLSSENRKIGETVLQLLNSPQDMTMQWRILTEQLIQRIKNHVINDFALNFHPLISEMIQDSGLISDLGIANLFKKIAEQESQSIVEDFSVRMRATFQSFSATKLEAIEKELQASFAQQKQIWEYYLDLSDLGVLRYLKDQFKIDLRVRKSKRTI